MRPVLSNVVVGGMVLVLSFEWVGGWLAAHTSLTRLAVLGAWIASCCFPSLAIIVTLWWGGVRVSVVLVAHVGVIPILFLEVLIVRITREVDLSSSRDGGFLDGDHLLVEGVRATSHFIQEEGQFRVGGIECVRVLGQVWGLG